MSALKGRNSSRVIPAFQASIWWVLRNQGRRASRLPLAFIFRAFGATDLQMLLVGGGRPGEDGESAR